MVPVHLQRLHKESFQMLCEAEVKKHCLAHGKFAIKNKSFQSIRSLFAWLAKEHDIHIKKLGDYVR
jgi:hypothetical protein